MHRAVMCGVVALLGIVAYATPAEAKTFGNAVVSDQGLEATVGSTPDPGSSHGGGRQSIEDCTTEAINPNVEGMFMVDNTGHVKALFDEQHKEDQGAWYRRVCTIGTTETSYNVYWVPKVDASALAKRALDTAQLPTPRIAITPTLPAVTYVNYPLWLWIDKDAWRTVTASASDGGLTATATATPLKVVWDSGDTRAQTDGDRYLTCNGPGKAKPANIGYFELRDGSDCTFYYAHTSGKQPQLTFPLAATIYWHATWTATNGTSGDLGTVSRSSSVPIQVGEYQVVNIAPKG